MSNYDNFIEELKASISESFEREIHDWYTIKKSIEIVINKNIHGFGKNIVDFIDLGNWDYISSYSFDDRNRMLELEWWSNVKFHIYIDSIFYIENNKSVYAFLKGYYHDVKTINKIYNTRCSSCNIEREGSYTISIERVIKGIEQHISSPIINCYTACILTRPPLGRVASVGTSRNLMDAINLHLASEKIKTLRIQINELVDYDRDTLQEKGNTARRYLEYILMLINVRVNNSKIIYQEEMLGGLTPVIELLDGKPTKREIQDAQSILNACSHHGGIMIEKNDVIFALDFIEKIISSIENTDINRLQLDNMLTS
ncbi:hypothetical protein ORN12_04515 [Pantoea vagans]|uniref:hypothetical protein n=1 Tax=Pantoea vagans TaxID=470934 RepID=UPI00225A0FF0|nr:hypothetical protein [Pantoea vagans]MCX3308272.1 hypothetical protein [Pantoea vagans]